VHEQNGISWRMRLVELHGDYRGRATVMLIAAPQQAWHQQITIAQTPQISRVHLRLLEDI